MNCQAAVLWDNPDAWPPQQRHADKAFVTAQAVYCLDILACERLVTRAQCWCRERHSGRW